MKQMAVKKRDGTLDKLNLEKIQKRIKDLAKDLSVNTDEIAIKAVQRMYQGIETREIDEHLAGIAVNNSVHPDYNILAGRICVSALHKETAINKLLEGEKDKLLKLMLNKTLTADHKLIVKLKNSLFEDQEREDILATYLTGKKVSEKKLQYLVKAPRFFYAMKTMFEEEVINERVMKLFVKYRKEIEEKIDYERDFMFDFFGFKTLESKYLLKKHETYSVFEEKNGEEKELQKTKATIIERPQDMFMRIAIAIVGDDSLERAFELYDLMSEGYYTHATPTLFNAGTKREQMSSCFLLANEADSIDGIFNTYKEEALVSKNSGGIGTWYHNVRSTDSIIKGTNGTSSGIIPFLKIKNEIARAVNQGGKRPGSIAVYLEPWHADVRDFIQLRKNNGIEEKRARNLFLALWIPNLFYKRVMEGGKWSFFNPQTAPRLYDTVGEEFERLYEQYESEGKAIDVVDAGEFMKDIFEVQIETGTPYILNKDHCNLKSNQQNLGVIKSSNLCTEIIQYSDEKETAVCNLASICLPKFVKIDKEGNTYFDHKHLHKVVSSATYNLNAVIDKNYYVNEKTERSNMRHRPIGLGVQGLADVFFKMHLPYTSDDAKLLNEEIFETIYHAALTVSVELAKRDGHYKSMKENGGSPISKGILQFDMWGHTPKSGRYNWDSLKSEIKEHGVRNSLMVAPMPTASTSQLFGNTESFEPLTENLYKRKVAGREFTVMNKYMVRHLESLGLWNEDVINALKTDGGSIQKITRIPEEVRAIYKTVWELSLRDQIDMSADRGAFICQSQSFNIHMEKPTMRKMADVYLYGYMKGLKTGSYYFRTQAAVTNQKVTVSTSALPTASSQSTMEDDDDCLVCGS